MNIQLSLHFIQITAEQPPALIGTIMKSSSPDSKGSFCPSNPLMKGLADEILRHHQDGFQHCFLPELPSKDKVSGAPFNPFSSN
jgi:hypothetical protein